MADDKGDNKIAPRGRISNAGNATAAPDDDEDDDDAFFKFDLYPMCKSFNNSHVGPLPNERPQRITFEGATLRVSVR